MLGDGSADDLLGELRASGQQVAFVVDEYGGTAGMVTMEDLMHALVGPIGQEPGPDSAASSHSSQPERESNGSLVLDGLTRLRDFEELSGVDLYEYEHDGVETVGGLVVHELGRMAEMGDVVHIGDRALRVEELDGLRIARVRVARAEARSHEDRVTS